MSQAGFMFEQSLKRGKDFHRLSEETKWAIDKSLGILDWDGNCAHQRDGMCDDCRKRYDEHIDPYKKAK